MSKRELRKYLRHLPKPELEEQILDLYAKFKNVKTYYDFVFNPDENALIEEAKYKIRKEYFPQNNRKPKARRSVAQKHFRHFIKLGMEADLVADLMLFNLETALEFSAIKMPRQEAFYISMLKSYREAMEFISRNCNNQVFQERLILVKQSVNQQNWFNSDGFDRA